MAPGAGQKDAREGRSGAGPSRTRGSITYRGEFRQSIEDMMYAFGDVEKPNADSVALVEDMTMTFLVDLCHRARPNSSKIPIPSNQNTINIIANGLLQQQQSSQQGVPLKGGEDEFNSSTDSNVSNRSNFRSTNTSRGTKMISTAASSQSQISTIPPRLAPHPYVAQSRMTVEDLKFACRKDVKLSSRIEELLYLDKVITAAQKAFHPEEEVSERTVGQ